MAKKTTKKDMTYPLGHEGMCFCKGLIAILIIVLVWINPTATWSRVIITIAAVLILLGAKHSYFSMKKK